MSEPNLGDIHESLVRIERLLEVIALRLSNIDEFLLHQEHFLASDEFRERIYERLKELEARTDERSP